MPVDLTYTPAIPAGRLVVHAGTLVDLTGPTARSNVDLVIERNRIVSVAPHGAVTHARGAVIDASS